MTSSPNFAEVGALIGDPARANMLAGLMDGRALTASELAFLAHISPQTASGHLAKLTEGRLLTLEKQGRHRYYRLASPMVGRLLEAVMAVASLGPPRHRPPSRIDEALRRARTCYDHLAGELGVALADALAKRSHIVLDAEGGEITAKGEKFLDRFGIDLAAAGKRRRAFLKPCLDWSERRYHIAGSVGALLAGRCFDLGWVARVRDTRALEITEAGRDGLAEHFGIKLGR